VNTERNRNEHDTIAAVPEWILFDALRYALQCDNELVEAETFDVVVGLLPAFSVDTLKLMQKVARDEFNSRLRTCGYPEQIRLFLREINRELEAL
jgi:hypothetical protein